MSELCEVVITAPDPDWLYTFARALIEDGLAASAHNYTPVRSIYRWREQLHERVEGRVSLHTSTARISDIVSRAKSQLPYEVPGVSARPIIGGNPDHLAWIAKETSTATAETPGQTS
jgi:periplasmic divalent cation tolerance protein